MLPVLLHVKLEHRKAGKGLLINNKKSAVEVGSEDAFFDGLPNYCTVPMLLTCWKCPQGDVGPEDPFHKSAVDLQEMSARCLCLTCGGSRL